MSFFPFLLLKTFCFSGKNSKLPFYSIWLRNECCSDGEYCSLWAGLVKTADVGNLCPSQSGVKWVLSSPYISKLLAFQETFRSALVSDVGAYFFADGHFLYWIIEALIFFTSLLLRVRTAWILQPGYLLEEANLISAEGSQCCAVWCCADESVTPLIQH